MPCPPRWPVVALVGLASGIALAADRDPRPVLLACAAIALCGLLACWSWGGIGSERAGWALLLALSSALGAARVQAEVRALSVDPLAGRGGLRLEVRGVVVEPPRLRRSGGWSFLFRVERVEQLPDLPEVTLVAELPGGPPPSPGERWRLLGALRRPHGASYPGGFHAAAWLARRGVHQRLLAEGGGRLAGSGGRGLEPLVWGARAWLLGSIEPHLEPVQLALLGGLMLGGGRDLPGPVVEAFRRTGTSHLLAASGLNVGVVVGGVLAIGSWAGLGARRVVWPALAAVAFYAALAGGSPSIVRASSMAAIGLLALAAGRRVDTLHALLLSGVTLLLARPLWLFEAGFQLSLAAVLGMVLLGPGLERRLGSCPGLLRAPVVATLSAGWAVTPLLVWHMQEVSVMTLPANLLLAPVAEALLPWGLGTCALAGVWPEGVGWPVFLLSLGLDYLLATASILSEAAEPLTVPRPGPAGLVGSCLLLGWLWLWLAGEGSRGGRLAVALVGAGLLLWGTPAPPLASGEARLRVVDLPGGCAAWFTTPGGRDWLVFEEAEVRQAAESMLAAQGRRGGAAVRWAGPGLEEGSPEGDGGGDLVVDRGPGWRRWSWRGFSWVWVTREATSWPSASVAVFAGPVRADLEGSPLRACLRVGSEPGAAAGRTPGAGWVLRAQGPLEVSSDGRVLTWRPWR